MKVLLVDDEQLILNAYERVLKKAGYEVTTALSARQALAAFAAERFDVIVSDILLRQLSGLDLLREVRRQDLDVPVLLMTGAPDLKTAIAAVELGAFAYLAKPFATESFLSTVERAAKLHQMALLKRQALEIIGSESHLLGDRASLEDRFRSALQGMFVVFQPIVSVARRRVVAYEALLRTSEELLSSPAAFLSAAARLGRLDELGRNIRAAVTLAAAALPPDTNLFVNLHPSDMMDPELFDGDAPLSAVASLVVLEVTERASLEQVADLGSRLGVLRDLGFRIAVDDLGAGYAGLTSLTSLEPDIVKLDMALVRGVDADPRRQQVVGSLIQLCRELNIGVVIEGVETAAEHATLTKLGGDLMQGYLFAKPTRGFGEAMHLIEVPAT